MRHCHPLLSRLCLVLIMALAWRGGAAQPATAQASLTPAPATACPPDEAQLARYHERLVAVLAGLNAARVNAGMDRFSLDSLHLFYGAGTCRIAVAVIAYAYEGPWPPGDSILRALGATIRDEGLQIDGIGMVRNGPYDVVDIALPQLLATLTPPAPVTATPTISPTPAGELARVLRVVDGDTIVVDLAGEQRRVRYIGINTPERDEPCAQDATAANARLVRGKFLRLLRDTSDTDRYGRLLRYVHVDGTFVNEALVRNGFAENSEWEPDTQFAARFRALEAEARAAGRGCHSTSVFDDGDERR